MNRHDRIVIDPEILVGKPVVKGTRLSVDFLLGLLAQGWGESEILRNYPDYYPSFSSLCEKNFHAASFAVLAWRAVSKALITSAPNGLSW